VRLKRSFTCSVPAALREYWIVTGFRHFPHAELIYLPHYWAVFMREVSATGDDSIFAAGAA